MVQTKSIKHSKTTTPIIYPTKIVYSRDPRVAIKYLKDNLEEPNKELALTARDLYGSNRIGTETPNFGDVSYLVFNDDDSQTKKNSTKNTN